MNNFVKKNKGILFTSLVAVLVFFFGLSFLNGKGNVSLTERERELANYDQVHDGDNLVNGTDYVTFDAYFVEKTPGSSEVTKYRGNYVSVNDNAELWLDLRVFGDVTLKDAKLELVNSNVKTSGYLYRNSIIPSNMRVPNGGIIELKPSISGSTLNNTIIISENVSNDISSHFGTNKIILTGTVVKPTGEEVDVEKTVEYTVDWYYDDFDFTISGDYNAKQSFPYNVVIDCPRNDRDDYYHHEWTGDNYKVTYSFSTISNYPFLKSANIETVIPDLNGYDPVNVTVKTQGVTSNYDATTQTLSIRREASLEGTLIASKAYAYKNGKSYYNEYEIEIEYPKEVEDASDTLQLPVKAYYEVFKTGQNGQIDIETSDIKEHVYTYQYIKPIIRKTINACGTEPPDRLELLYNEVIGSRSSALNVRYVDRTALTKTYAGDDTALPTTTFSVSWNVYLSYFDKFEEDSITSFTMTDQGADRADSYTLNGISRYKTIYFSGFERYLGSSGYIKLINNDTNEIIHMFTALDWNTAYTFEDNVYSIRIETSELVNKDLMRTHYERFGWQDNDVLNLFSISITKEIDNNIFKSTYTQEQFDSMSNINSSVRIGGTRYRTEEKTIDPITSDGFYASANLINHQSAQIDVSSNKAAINSTVVNDVEFTISVGQTGDIVEGYKNAEYVLVLPEWILDYDINSITSSDVDVTITGFEKDTVNNHKVVRIITENDVPKKYSINVNLSIIPDARELNKSGSVIIYASNPSTNLSNRSAQDKYDVDGDKNTEEYQNYGYCTISLSAPNEIITTTTINYTDNSDNSKTVVSPMVAEVDPIENRSDAEIEIGLTNNALYPTKDIKVIGKLAYQGNTYQIGSGDLGSEFDVIMLNSGIRYVYEPYNDEGIANPNNIANNIKIYYSDQETPDDDLNKASNNWKLKENVSDFSTIKTYMIVINDYTLEVGDRIKFIYDITIPNNTSNLNKATYFTHGVYYNILTNSGDLSSFVGGGKLGIRISRQFNLDITDLKINSSRVIADSKYLLTDADGEQKIITTDSTGHGLAKNLYVGKQYTLKQLRVKAPYILDEEEKTIEVVNGTNDVLAASYNGVLKSAELEGTKKLNVVHENEVRYDLLLENTDLETDEPIALSQFKVTGKGYENGTTVIVGSDGKMLLNGLYINEEYDVEQIRADKYLKTKDFKIKLIRDNNGNIKVKVNKKPVIGEPLYLENIESYSRENDVLRFVSDYESNIFVALPVDMTGLSENYQAKMGLRITGYGGSYNTWTYIFAYEGECDDSKNMSDINSFWVYTNRRLDSTYTYTTANLKYPNMDNYYYGDSFKGGRKYCIKMIRPEYAPDFYVTNFTITPVDGTIEIIDTTDIVNSPIVGNENAFQTYTDSNNQDAPVLKVNVKNQKIPTYTLRINKLDAETKEPLAGAQYRVTGPGLPENGKYLTTDDNGQASIDLYKDLQHPGWYENFTSNGIDVTQISANYKVEEITAPVGYTLDQKSIEFHGKYLIDNNTMNCSYDTYNCVYDFNSQESTIEINYLQTTEGEFIDPDYDVTTNIVDVTLYDYPIIKIIKKDAETGEVLPNTLFAIYEVTNVNSAQVLSPAKDIKGNIIGDEITINGKQYRVVTTDSNGQLNLSLSQGKYKLQEVQAADEKYELNKAIYYFGVGETVPYRPEGVEYVGNVAITNSFDSGGDQTSNIYKMTSDGGVVHTTQDGHIIKYDSDLNVEWDVDGTVPVSGTAYVYNYPDRDPRWGVSRDNPNSTDPYAYGVFEFDPGDPVNMLNVMSDSTSRYSPTDIVETSDGGFIVNGRSTNAVIKFDKDGNRLWQSETSVYHQKRYFDKICTYEGNTNANGDVLLYEYDSSTDTWSPVLEQIYNESTYQWEYTGEYEYFTIDPNRNDEYKFRYRDAETYYCDYDTYNSETGYGDYGFQNTTYWAGHVLAELPDGGVAILSCAYGNSYYSTPQYEVRLSDGTIVYPYNIEQIWVYDGDGHLVQVIDAPAEYEAAFADYKAKYNIDYSGNIVDHNHWVYHDELKSYKNGDLLVFLFPGRALKMAKNTTTGQYETVWFTPIGVNGSGISNWYGNGDGRPDIVPNDETGGFYAKDQYSQFTISDSYVDPLYSGDNLKLDIEKEPYKDGESYPKYTYTPIFNFVEKTEPDGSKQAYLQDLALWAQTTRNTYDYYVYGNENLLKRFYSSVSGLSAIQVSDGGYIVGFKPAFYSGSYDSDFSRMVVLKSGETRIIRMDTYVIMKMDASGGIEWIKEYENMSYYTTNPHARISADGNRILMPVRINQGMTATEVGNPDFSITNTNNSNGIYLLVFDLTDEIQPSGPEAYTLNVENKRKEYNITASSNIGGEVVVTNPENGQNVITTDGATTVLEKVKYGDTNKYDITIVPNTNNTVASVKINGKDAPYTVNADGTVSLNKIVDIKEDKNITITYAQNKSIVVVKHYLKGTTESVFGDDILLGEWHQPYDATPKTNDLYDVEKDGNGEYIFPDNITGEFSTADDPITVIFYYVENEVDLRVNYYVDGTDTELAPSDIERRTLGSRYQTSPKSIRNYNVTRTIGDPSGTLDTDLTEVTYMYRQATESKITIRHVDKATNQNIVEPIVKTVPINSQYTTDDSVTIPAKYRLLGTPANAAGPATDAEIEVIYYYEVIPFNISVDKKINSILLNNKNQSIDDAKNFKITPVQTDELIVYYEIDVENTGDIKATFKVVEKDIPGFEIYDKGAFEKTNSGYELSDSLEPKEKKTYKIAYKWNQKYFGLSTNEVEIVDVANPNGFAEPDETDNTSTATIELGKGVLPTPPTIIPNTVDKIVISVILFVISVVGMITLIILTRKKRMK